MQVADQVKDPAETDGPLRLLLRRLGRLLEDLEALGNADEDLAAVRFLEVRPDLVGEFPVIDNDVRLVEVVPGRLTELPDLARPAADPVGPGGGVHEGPVDPVDAGGGVLREVRLEVRMALQDLEELRLGCGVHLLARDPGDRLVAGVVPGMSDACGERQPAEHGEEERRMSAEHRDLERMKREKLPRSFRRDQSSSTISEQP